MRPESGLRRSASRLPALRVLRLATNVGHGPAIRFGLEQCAGTFVFQTDSDRQHTPEDFWLLWERRDQADFVFGVRLQRSDPPIRRWISLILRCANFLLWGCWIHDANCPFKLMRRAPLDAFLAEIPRDSFIPMVMISVLARYHGHAVIEQPVRHFARTAGEHSLKGALRWCQVGLRCLRELLRLRLSMARHVVRERARRASTEQSR